MIYYQRGDEKTDFTGEELKLAVEQALSAFTGVKKVLVIPPDFTRYHSRAGEITRYVWEIFQGKEVDILPALGTHFPLTDGERVKMFGNIPTERFLRHDWRKDVISLGRVPSSFIKEISEERVDYDWPAQVNRILVEGGYDLILSVGQVVPHEVIGMANYNKNIFVGTGGAESINKSHFLGAAYGMERIMGRADNPVRQVLDYASDHFAKDLPVVYFQTVIARNEEGRLATRGLFVGNDRSCFEKAAALSLKVNFSLLDEPLKRVVVYLDPEEFKSTWLGNKSIYRTRMAIADEGEIIVLAPGLREFGEDRTIDTLIRKYGYIDTPGILELTRTEKDLGENLSAAAHLIHGSSEGRFKITYCTPGIPEKDIRSVNYEYADYEAMIRKYNPDKLKDGMNVVDGEEIFYVSNPALGLWSTKERFA